jgi:hypothetical protein
LIFQDAIDKMNSTLKATVVMLKGLEDNKEKQSRKPKNGSEGKKFICHVF